MDIAPEVIALDDHAKASGVAMTRALERAKVAPSTWYRWRNNGVDPHSKTLRRLRAAIEALKGEAA